MKTYDEAMADPPGFTWNPVGGCKHSCRWEMPDGSIRGNPAAIEWREGFPIMEKMK